MSENYVECLVAAKPSVLFRTLKYVCYFITVFFVVSIAWTYIIGLLLACIFGALAYFCSFYADTEFEYLYVDKELTVDKVLAKAKRKKVDTFSLDKMEIIAPIHSHELDSYKNRSVKERDFSTGREEQPDGRYVIYYEGNQKLIISPSPELIKAMKNNAPRKVITY